MTASPSHRRLLQGLPGDGRPLSLDEHIACHGPLAAFGRRRPDPALIDMVERAGLRGRGGANFPTARKLAAVAGGRGRRVVVANGAEGEPGSGKDRVLLTRTPHLVLDGAAVAAQAVGADTVIVATQAACAEPVAAAVAERDAQRLDRIPAVVAAVPERFIAGEESALVSFLNAATGLPTFIPPRPYERGIGGQPTLVQNVETLAHLGLIARHGPEWFRGIGTPIEPGSTLLTVQGALGRPGVYEVARGSRLSDLIAQAGGPTAPVQAFLIGGYAGAWIAADQAWDAPLSDDSLIARGGILAAGVVLALPDSACGVAETARIVRYLADESAGQCGPCVHGLAAIAQAADDLARGTARHDVLERLEAWCWQVTGRGACHHPDGATRLVASALRTFSGDVAAHRQGLPCPAAPRPRTTSGRKPPARTATR